MSLHLGDIAVTYGRGRATNRAVRGVSLTVRAGETLALVGESGSGKSTIARVAAGLQRATSGTVVWSTEAATGTPTDRRRVQMVFQHPVQSLDPTWTIGRSIGEPARRGVESDRRVADLLERVGLDRGMANRFPRDISGGQAQRVAVARALIAQPEIVILDEPTASLDQTVRARILALLADVQQSTGVGYLLVTHDMSSVRAIAHRVAVMYRGELVETGSADDLFRAPMHPYTRALIAAVPVADPRVAWDPSSHIVDSQDPDRFRGLVCAVGGDCAEHGPGLHDIGPDRQVACIVRSGIS